MIADALLEQRRTAMQKCAVGFVASAQELDVSLVCVGGRPLFRLSLKCCLVIGPLALHSELDQEEVRGDLTDTLGCLWNRQI